MHQNAIPIHPLRPNQFVVFFGLLFLCLSINVLQYMIAIVSLSCLCSAQVVSIHTLNVHVLLYFEQYTLEANRFDIRERKGCSALSYLIPVNSKLEVYKYKRL